MAPPKVIPTSVRHTTTLAQDLESTGLLRNKAKKRKSLSEEDAEGTGSPNVGYVDAQASRKILKIGRDLVEEEEQEEESRRKGDERLSHGWQIRDTSSARPYADETYEADELASDDGKQFANEEEWGDEHEFEEAEIDPNDLELFNRFVPPVGEAPTLKLDAEPEQVHNGTSLADLILKEIAAYEARQTNAEAEADTEREDDEIPPKVVEVYSKVGMIMSRYKSGKLPKPFKILPTLPQWEVLVEITQPDNWTPNAIYEATRTFVTARPVVVQRFLETVVLERVRAEIYETKRLNVHLFNALKRSTYKPAGFFKGFLFPLVQSGTCTLREAHVVSGVLARCSIPVLHSAAALLRLTDIAAEQSSVSTESGGATNIFIRVLLEKKYALPYKVVDNLVFHFLRFRNFDSRAHGTDVAMDTDTGNNTDRKDGKDWKLPVLWHRSLLAFAQRYRNDITEDQREALLDLLLLRWHKDIGPEVRRELLAGRGRGIPVIEDGGHDAGDDTMVMDPI